MLASRDNADKCGRLVDEYAQSLGYVILQGADRHVQLHDVLGRMVVARGEHVDASGGIEAEDAAQKAGVPLDQVNPNSARAQTPIYAS